MSGHGYGGGKGALDGAIVTMVFIFAVVLVSVTG